MRANVAVALLIGMVTSFCATDAFEWGNARTQRDSFGIVGRTADPPPLGWRVKLPATDSKGRKLPTNHGLLIIALSCESCTLSKLDLSPEKGLNRHPILLVAKEEWELSQLAKLGDSYYYCEDKQGQILSASMWRFSPEAVLVNKQGTVFKSAIAGPEVRAMMEEYQRE